MRFAEPIFVELNGHFDEPVQFNKKRVLQLFNESMKLVIMRFAKPIFVELNGHFGEPVQFNKNGFSSFLMNSVDYN